MFDNLISELGDNQISPNAMIGIIDNKKAVCMNILGIIAFDENEIVVKYNKNQKAIISGEKMVITLLDKNNVTCTGRIQSFRIENL